MVATSSPMEDQASEPNRWIGYMRRNARVCSRTDTLPIRATSAGGGDSTVKDLLAFANALTHDKLLVRPNRLARKSVEGLVDSAFKTPPCNERVPPVQWTGASGVIARHYSSRVYSFAVGHREDEIRLCERSAQHVARHRLFAGSKVGGQRLVWATSHIGRLFSNHAASKVTRCSLLWAPTLAAPRDSEWN